MVNTGPNIQLKQHHGNCYGDCSPNQNARHSVYTVVKKWGSSGIAVGWFL